MYHGTNASCTSLLQQYSLTQLLPWHADQVVSTVQQDVTQCDMHCCVVLLCDAHNLITVPRKKSCQAFVSFLLLFLAADVVKKKSV